MDSTRLKLALTIAFFASPGCTTLEFPDADCVENCTEEEEQTPHNDDDDDDVTGGSSGTEGADAYTGCFPGEDECGSGKECVAVLSGGQELEGFVCDGRGTISVGDAAYSSVYCEEGSAAHSHSAACTQKTSAGDCCTPLCDLNAVDCTMEIDEGNRTIQGECVEADDGLHPDVAHFGICQFAEWSGCDPLEENACHEGAGCQIRSSSGQEFFACVKAYDVQKQIGASCSLSNNTDEKVHCAAGLSCIEKVCTFACSVEAEDCEQGDRTGTCQRHFPKAETPEGMEDLGFCELDPLPEELGLAEQ